jgi:hypothetical protein
MVCVRTECTVDGCILQAIVVIQQSLVEGIEGRTDGIMQTQCLVPVPPLVSHSWAFIQNQRQDIQEFQPGPEVQTALSGSDDHDVRLDTFKPDLLLSLLRPFATVRRIL